MPSIISPNQTGYVKGRNIRDSIRLIQDIIRYLEFKQKTGILITIDFQKAFDSLDWSLLTKTLHYFNFGDNLIRWVKLFYNDICSCVINNGETTKYFDVSRGVRQGDPLSPYLFTLGVEILSIALTNSRKINGINVKDKEFKFTQYADDLTLLLSDTKSVLEAKELLYSFGKCSGLQINNTKTDGIGLGAWKNRLNVNCDFNLKQGPIKVLGIYISNNPDECIMLNFESKIDALMRQLHWWKARDLTLYGRVLIVKTLAIPKFQYLASLVNFPTHITNKINSLIYEFVWKGQTDKVKRDIFQQEEKLGGFKLTNFVDIVKANSAIWIKKYFDDHDRHWKNTFEYFCGKANLNIFLSSKFDTKELPTKFPKYYTDAIMYWKDISASKNEEIL